MRALRVGVFVVCFSVSASAALPSDMAKLLERMPGKKLNLDLVIGRAVQSSDSFRLVQSGRIAAAAPRLLANSVLDTRLTLFGEIADDQREPLSPFNPSRIETKNVGLGVSTYFQTGTTVALDLKHGSTDLRFNAIPPIGPFGFNETRADLNLSQNLWQDAFGHGTRKGLLAGELSEEAAIVGVQQATDAWVQELSQIFYLAWLSQAEVRSSLDNVRRKKRLEDITRIKLRRGTAEEPDLLQVKSSLIDAEVRRDQAAQTLADRWRGLVISLKLPESWLAVDPSDIPLALDQDALNRAETVCGKSDQIKASPETSSAIKQADLLARAAELRLQQAKAQLAPDLELRGGVGSNGVDTQSGSTFGETAKGDHPAWAVGVALTVPLGFYAEKANALKAAQEAIQSETRKQQTLDSLKLDWLNACTDFFRRQKAFDAYSAAAKNQKRRVDLEEDRFQLGRASMLQVIQAGDDATLAEMNMNAAEVERRSAAWRVNRIADQIPAYLENLKNDKSLQTVFEGAL